MADSDAYLPLMAMAAGLLAPSQGQRGFAGGLGRGLLGGLQAYQTMGDMQDRKRSQRLQELQLQLAGVRMQKEAAQEAARQMALAKLGAGKTPDEQAMLAAAPEAALQAFAAQMFPQPITPWQQAQMGLQRDQMTQDSEWRRLQFEAARGDQAAEMALRRRSLALQEAEANKPGESWGIVSGDQAKALGLPDGFWQVSSKGQVKALDGSGGGESWRTLTSDEAAKMGLAPGTVASVSNKGKLEVEQQPKGGGLDIQWNPDGSLGSISMGGPPRVGTGTMSLTTPNATAVQKDVIGLDDQASRLETIRRNFRPEYQQLGERLGNAWTAGREKLGMAVAPEDQAALGNYTAYRSEAVNNLNQIMKEQSGSAVTGNEFERNTAALPSAGTGIFDGDSPTEFQAKLNTSISRVKMANARKKYLLAKGIQFDFRAGNNGGISLDNMPEIIDAEGERIERDLLAKGASPAEAEQQTARQLQQIFGL